MGKSPRKSGGKVAPSAVSGKNIQKLKQHSRKKYPKKGTAAMATLKVPKTASRRFSLASESSLSSVSDDTRNFHNVPVFDSSSDEEEKNVEMNAIMGPSSSESDSDSNEDEFSSDDDSDVDFVQLTKEKKARAIKAAKSRKNPRKSNPAKKYPKPVVVAEPKEDVTEIEFKFKFDKDGNETFKLGENESEDDVDVDEDDDEDEDEDENDSQVIKDDDKPRPEEEEDLGEEVAPGEFKLIDNNYDSNVLSDGNSLKTHLMMDVPKIKEDEINSDEDYEIDDDKLIQTLQNDNDDLELTMLDDDDDSLAGSDDGSEAGEELLDANEFDNLSFEGEEDIDDYGDLIEAEGEKNYLMKEEENAMAKDFDTSRRTNDDEDEEEEDEDDVDGYLRYLSEDSILFEDDNDDEVDEEERKNRARNSKNDDEFGFFNNPFQRASSANVAASPRSSKLSKRKFSVHSEGEFHWPFMRKIDDSDSSSYYSSDDEDDEDEDDEDSAAKVKDEKLDTSLEAVPELPVHSGDSTDEDTNLPKKVNRKLTGVKMVAKEVLSTSETVPPLLGKWRTSDSDKPFGIIDGLSTRSLQPEHTHVGAAAGTGNGGIVGFGGRLLATGSGNLPKKSSTKVAPGSGIAEEPMLIDELLNMSGLEEDEDEDEVVGEVDNVGFVFSKHVPLSAFRNKGYVPSSITDSMEQLKRYSLTNKKLISSKDDADSIRLLNDAKHVNFRLDHDSLRKAHKKKKKKEKRMQKLRKQSIVELAKEGLRSTKSGLFSENTIADVELFLLEVEPGDEFSILFSGVI